MLFEFDAELTDDERRRALKRFPAVNPAPIKKPEPGKKPGFEQSLARLEEIVRRLESASLSLDDAMKLFEEGVALSRDCQQQLDQAEGKVEILLKKAGGEIVAQPFATKGDADATDDDGDDEDDEGLEGPEDEP
jgi:exodeoxyribonuclease VII small subunit